MDHIKIRRLSSLEKKTQADEIVGIINNALYNGLAEPGILMESYISATGTENLIAESDGELAGFFQAKFLPISNSTYLSVAVTHPKYRKRGIYRSFVRANNFYTLANGSEFEIGRTANPRVVKALAKDGFEYKDLSVGMRYAAILAMKEMTGHSIKRADVLIFPGKYLKTYPLEPVRESSGDHEIDDFVGKNIAPGSCDRLVLIKRIETVSEAAVKAAVRDFDAYLEAEAVKEPIIVL